MEHTPEILAAIRTLADAGVTPSDYRTAMRALNPLPTWTEMSDLDKGAAIKFDMACESEGNDYATEHYPCQFLEDPRLVTLDKEEAARHALDVLGDDIYDRIGGDEYNRLCDLAINHKAADPDDDED